MKNILVRITIEAGKFTEFTVYKIKKNVPYLVGVGTYQNGCNAHLQSEAVKVLKDHKEITDRKYSKNVYIESEAIKAGFKIHLI